MAIPIEACCPEQDPEYSISAKVKREVVEIADELDCLEARTAQEADLLFRASAALRAIQKIALVEIDPGDGSVRPNLEYVLIRGFSAMGWAQPSLAAHQLMESIAQSTVASKSHD